MHLNVATEFGLPGAEHMQRDIRMADTVRAGGTPTLRLYTWQPWAVSLGRNQNEEHLDTDAIAERGWQVVRRPTGGRAVLHAEELTYAIAIPLSDGRTPGGIYSFIHDLLLQALAPLVPGLAFTSVGANLQHHYASAGASAMSCFTTAARSEIHHNGRKIVGSAQRVIDGVVLQHGSILTGRAHMNIAHVLNITEEERMALLAQLDASATSLSEVAGVAVTPEMVAERIVRSLT